MLHKVQLQLAQPVICKAVSKRYDSCSVKSHISARKPNKGLKSKQPLTVFHNEPQEKVLRLVALTQPRALATWARVEGYLLVVC